MSSTAQTLLEQKAQKLFEAEGWLVNGDFTPDGLMALTGLVRPLPTVWGKTQQGNPGRYGPLFDVLMGKNVPLAVELVVVKAGQVLLTWRKFKGTVGWHTPGSYMNPGETWQDTASRIANEELECDVWFEKTLHQFNNNKNPRFHDTTTLVLCELNGDPKISRYDPNVGDIVEGQFAWFDSQPSNLLPVHDKYWPVIESVLKE